MQTRMQQQQQWDNGRVDLRQGESAKEYPLFSESRSESMMSTAVRSMRQVDTGSSAVARLFFSSFNLDALQSGSRYRVCAASLEAGAAPPGYIIGRQNERELGIVMLGIYQQHGRNVTSHVAEQVRDLNSRVLDFVVPRVLQEVMSYHQYRVDIATPRPVMMHAQIAGMKGSRQLGAV